MKKQQLLELAVNMHSSKRSKVDLYSFACEHLDMNIEWNNVLNIRLEEVYVSEWICTDTKVGIKVYIFDNIPVAIGQKLYRKSDEYVTWVSEQSYKDVKKFAQELFDTDDSIDLIDMDEEITPRYKIDFYNALFSHQKNECYFNDEKVSIVGHYNSYNEDISRTYHPEMVDILFENDTVKKVLMGDLEFPYNK